MGELASAPAFLLIGNNASEQNPLVAWQIRSAIRHVGARLYIVDSSEPKLRRKAKLYVQVESGAEGCGAPSFKRRLRRAGSGEWLARIACAALYGGKRADRSVRRGGARSGTRRSGGIGEERARGGQRTRFMALGDYANSRGASDMGLLPDRLPGYAAVEDPGARNVWQVMGRSPAGKTWACRACDARGRGRRQNQGAVCRGRESR